MTGKLYGLGVGPGDPELLTVKALRLVKESDVVAVPGAVAEESVAYKIVKGVYQELDEKKEGYEEIYQVAQSIVDTISAEAMTNVRVAYGTIVQELKDVSKSYKEAMMAIDVGKIFYAEKRVNSYATLGIGRLIYQLPTNLCKIFMEEIFGDTDPGSLDDEIVSTAYKFFENNLNVSETSRQLFIHRKK